MSQNNIEQALRRVQNWIGSLPTHTTPGDAYYTNGMFKQDCENSARIIGDALKALAAPSPQPAQATYTVAGFIDPREPDRVHYQPAPGRRTLYFRDEAQPAQAPQESSDPLRAFRGVQAFLESLWRGANANIGVDRDDVAIAIRTLQGALDAADRAQRQPAQAPQEYGFDPAAPVWISVYERIPQYQDGEDGVRVLVLTNDHDFAGVKVHDVPASDFYAYDPDSDEPGTEVTKLATHWMHIPPTHPEQRKVTT